MKKTPIITWISATALLFWSCNLQESNENDIEHNTQKTKIEITNNFESNENTQKIQEEETEKDTYHFEISETDTINSPYKDMIKEYTQALILWNLTKPEIAITIDDWNWANNIETILDTLKNHNIKATFFIVWTRIRMHASQRRRAIDEWHQICNHTFNHHYFKKTNPQELEKQILDRESAVIDSLWEDYLKTMKQNFPFFRFPWWFGAANPELISVLKKHWYIAIWRSTDRRNEWTKLRNWEIALFHFKPQDFERIWAFARQAETEWKSCKQITDITDPGSWYSPIWRNNRQKKEIEAREILKEQENQLQIKKDSIN